ncbi:MAG: hypothetical protein A3F47_01640 [Candidatus Staskawiczbacteria bacterium RIFCSPHIGHO2_12_FULL_38_11]|uniref:Uncharacterized protein n=1 Tax=Candidatus Staskawiczbacteria bacterium RIFCSPHIGHO2_12_FULL_38_11 TaxID=1802209 RepID=A0A1G2I565_9BACT|nr:MAG: hypothetical protein A3F47_01640 [Candidatus Staskawiczbacteria bacterium RIFCSPHIGHO2_12_FULL_38_11]
MLKKILITFLSETLLFTILLGLLGKINLGWTGFIIAFLGFSSTFVVNVWLGLRSQANIAEKAILSLAIWPLALFTSFIIARFLGIIYLGY